MHRSPHAARAAARRIRSAALTLLLSALALASPRAAHSATPLDSVYTTDGTVSAVATTGTRTFLGGNFTRVGPVTGNIATFLPAMLDPTPGYRMASRPIFTNNLVYVSIPDGAGGWYVGGQFTQWQGLPRQGLAHLLADGTLSPFAPALSGGGTFSGVRALALAGGRLYVGGDFTTLGGQPCDPLLAFENDSNAPLAWNSGVTAPVHSLLASGDTLYAGGTFRTVAGLERPSLAAFDAVSGALLPVQYPGPQPGGNVTALGTGDGTLRIGGSITNAGAPTGAAAFVDTSTGAALAPHFDVQGTVLAVAPDGAGGWYLGGAFSAVHGHARTNLARVGPDGMPTSWNPAPNDTVHALALAGDTLFAGGAFTLAGTSSRVRFAAWRASTGELLSGTPAVDGRVKTLVVSGGQLYLGGLFSLVGGLPSEGLAAIDRATFAQASRQPPGAMRLVNTLLAAHGRIYAAGAFTSVTSPAGNIALTDTLGTPAAGLPLCDGTIEVIESDGAGGWFVGGYFSLVGGVSRRSLARVLPDGSVDAAWNAELLSEASVLALTRVGARLYVGGYSLRTVSAQNATMVALDVATAALVSWPVPVVSNAVVTSIGANADSVWFGGQFSAVNGQPRSCLASVLASNGALTTWAPLVTFAGNQPSVLAVEYANGVVHAGGSFSVVGGLNRSSFVALDGVTGVPTALTANATNVGPGIVRALQVSSTHVYLGGSFATVNGSPRTNLAGVARTNGQVLGWNVAPDASVFALSLWGSKLYLGGGFSTVASTARARTAAIHALTGVLDAWNPVVPDIVHAVERSGETVAFGGRFVSLGASVRGGVCAFDPATNALLPFTANANGEVRALAATDQHLYLGGQFTNVGGLGRVRFAEVTTSGATTTWAITPQMTVHTIALLGSRLYLGGEKVQAGYVGAWDRTSHTLQSWSCNPVGIVRLLQADGSLLVAGACSGIGGAARTNAFALRTDTGALTPWAPRFDQGPNHLQLHSGRWYAGGTFSAVNDTLRYGMAAFDAGSGALLTWTPAFDASVLAFTFAHDTLLAGGSFTTVGGVRHRNFVMLDEATGAPLSSEHSANAPVETICLSGGSALATGRFSSFSMVPRNALAALDEHGRALPWSVNLTGSVLSLAMSGAHVYAAGNFWLFDPPARDFAAAFDTATAAVGPWAPQPDGTVYSLRVLDGSAWFGGTFTAVGGATRHNIGQTDLATGLATSWNPNANGPVFAIAKDGGTVYVGGIFTTVGGQLRNRIAALDATTGLATAWNPNASNTVNAIAIAGDRVYAGGAFTTIGGASRRRLAALSTTTGLATAWNPDPNGTVNVLDQRNGLLFVGGLFGSFGNGAVPRAGLAVLDTATGVPTPFVADANATVYDLAHANGALYVAGAFTTLGGQTRSGIAALVDPSWNLELLDAPPPTRAGLALSPATPQPLRSRGVLRFTLPSAGRAKLALHDLAGREVAVMLDAPSLAAGTHEVALDAGRLQPGVYWARLQWNGETRAQKVVTLR